MKGLQGLILAAGLGVTGFILNWAYLSSRAHNEVLVQFIGIKKDIALAPGESLRQEMVESVGLPRSLAGNLDDFAFKMESLSTVLGQPVSRPVRGPCLLFENDMRTAPEELSLKEDEKAMWIPVDTRAFVPSLVRPGDMVSFLVGKNFSPATAAPINPESTEPQPDVVSTAPLMERSEIIGPFKVLALGNRLSSAEVMKSNKIPQLQENVMTIAVRAPNGVLEAKAQTLWDRLQASNYRQVGVLLNSRTK